MEQASIFYPFLGVMCLTLCVWVYLFVRRIPFILNADCDINTLGPNGLAEHAPPAVNNPSDNLKNLFEMPVLFYALCLYLYVTQQVDGTYLTAAWIFFAFRLCHSLMHCTRNIVNIRFYLYAIASLAFWFMLLRVIFNLL